LKIYEVGSKNETFKQGYPQDTYMERKEGIFYYMSWYSTPFLRLQTTGF